MAGLIGIGRNTLGQANVGFQQSANLEDNRNAMGDQLRQARAAQRSSMVTTGAGLGGSIGVNNAMAASAAAKAGAAAGTGAVGTAPAVLATAAPEVLATAAPEVLTTAGAEVLAGTVVPTVVPAAVPAVAAPAAAAPMAGVMAIATPLLIGAGAALLLDSMFDIF